MKVLIIVLSAVIESITLRVWFMCLRFTDIFHYAALNIPYQIDTSINAFQGMPMKAVRLFHNKGIQIPIDVIRLYLQFWDVRFGANWFSVIGYFGIFAGFYYFISNKKKKIYHWIVVALLLILPCIEIFFDPSLSLFVKSIYLWLPFILFSFYGIYQFLNHGDSKKRFIFIMILLAVSVLWLLLLFYNITPYCVKPPLIHLLRAREV